MKSSFLLLTALDFASVYETVFKMLDVDESGAIEEVKLRLGLDSISRCPSDEELQEMINVVNVDGSGEIDLAEFIEFMMSGKNQKRRNN